MTIPSESSIGPRIVIVGNSNSGKSTLGRRLAGQLGARFIELDELYWEPNWVEPAIDVFRERVHRAIACDSWVIAGNYTQQVDVSWPLADTIVWLDLPLHLVLRRCIIRTWRRWRSQEVLWSGNRENFWEHLMLWSPKKSLISYTVVRHRSRRRRYEAQMNDPRWSHLSFVRLRTTRDVEDWAAACCGAAD